MRPDEIVPKEKMRPRCFIKTLDPNAFASKKVAVIKGFNLNADYNGAKGRWETFAD